MVKLQKTESESDSPPTELFLKPNVGLGKKN